METSHIFSLGASQYASRAGWLMNVDREFFISLPHNARRFSLIIEGDKTTILCGAIGAAPHGSSRRLWAQIFGNNANMLPKGAHRAIPLEGQFDRQTLRFEAKTPKFISKIGLQQVSRLPMRRSEMVKRPTAQLANLGSRARVWRRRIEHLEQNQPPEHLEQNQPPEKWTDKAVKKLLEQIRECLVDRPDIFIDVNDRQVVGKKRVIEDSEFAE